MCHKVYFLKENKMPRNTSQPPAKFHYIWLGCDIPEAYLRNIKTMASFAKAAGVEINLWVNKPSNYHHVVERDPSLRVYGLRLRSIDTIPELLSLTDEAQRFAYEHSNKLSNADLKNLLTYAQHECIGLSNFAAASDIYRLLILYTEGGYYFDTDLVPKCPLSANIDFRLPEAKEGFQILAIPPDHEIDRPGSVINAAVSACAAHEIIIHALIHVAEAYRALYKEAKEHGVEFSDQAQASEDMGFFEYSDPKPKYDPLALKRMPGGQNSAREHITIQVSGPKIYWQSIITYCMKYNVGHPLQTHEISPLRFPLSSTNEDLRNELEIINFGNVGYELKCDNTWLNPSNEKKKGFEI